MKLWGGRFTKPTHQLVDDFNASLRFDQRMYRQDIRGSIAHVQMLGRCGIIPFRDAEQIAEALSDICAEIDNGQFVFDLSAEDIHMSVERRLIEKIGPIGGRLHTGRSRNDQVALDTHLYLRDEIDAIDGLLADLQLALLKVAEENLDTIMPGYTHLQRAQPVLLAHHLLAYFEMLQRDQARLADCRERTNVCPLGAGAIAGTTFPIDREWVATTMEFSSVYTNSMDAVADRDYLLEFQSFAAIAMMHLSRLSEELILWSSQEFAFIELDDAFTTGSSMMPQKKNPDVAELVRGKTGRVYGNLMGLLTACKGLPLTYNKDLQEDKEGLFDTIDTLKDCLRLYAEMIRTMQVHKERMRSAVEADFSNATDMADYLVKKGLPFRQAHEIVGKAVLYCIENKKWLQDLSVDEFASLSAEFGPDIRQALTPDACIAARDCIGGTSQIRVEEAVRKAKNRLNMKNCG